MHRECCNLMNIIHKIAKLLIIMGFIFPWFKGKWFGNAEAYFSGICPFLLFRTDQSAIYWVYLVSVYVLALSAVILFIASIKIPWQRTVGMIFSVIGGILSITIMILAPSLDYIYSIHIGLFVLLTGFILSFIYYITKLKTA